MEALQEHTADWMVHSKAERRLRDAMLRTGLSPLLKPVVEGFELDFALEGEFVRLNVEVDGSQHVDQRGKQRRRDLQRDRILEKAGWTAVRYPAWRCLSEADAIVAELVTLLHGTAGAD